MMKPRVFLSVIPLAGLAMLLFWWSSTTAWRQHEMQMGLAEWSGMVTGHTLFRWDMNGPADVVLNAARNLDELRVTNGALVGRVAARNNLLSFNLAGRAINARHYHRLRIRVYSSGRTKWRLFHQAGNTHEYLASGFTFIRKGWQELDLDLATLPWTTRVFDPTGALLTEHPGRWGGDAGRVTALGIQPARDPGTAFRIDWVAIDRETLPDAQLSDIAATAGTYAPVVLDSEAALQSGWLFVLPRAPRTPERALWWRDRARDRAADAIVLPRRPLPSELVDMPAVLVAPVTEMGRRGWWGAAAFVLAAALWFAAGRRMGSGPRSLGDVLILIAGGLGLLVGVQDLTQAPPWSLLWGTALLVFVIAAVWRDGQVGHPGTRRAWAVSLAITTVAALLLLLPGPREPGALAAWPLAGISYLPWAIVQQFFIGPFLAVRAVRFVPRPEQAAVLTGLLFGALHYPNFALMTGTLLMGSVWAWLFLRYRSFAPLAVSHAILAPLPLATVPVWLLRSAEAGARFWQ